MHGFSFNKIRMGPTKRLLLLVADVCIFVLAAMLAWVLRVGLDYASANYKILLPYVLVSLIVSSAVFFFMKLNRHFFRFFSVHEFTHVAAAVTLAVLVTLLVSFTHFRLEGVQRSLPFIHWLLALVTMSAMRLTGRGLISLSDSREKRSARNTQREAILVIGFTPVAELCLRSLEIIGKDKILAVGIVDEDAALKGHGMRHCEVIGTPWELSGILAKLSIHGLRVRRVIMATKYQELSERSRLVLDALEKDNIIVVQDFLKVLEPLEQPLAPHGLEISPPAVSSMPLPETIYAQAEMALARYGRLKRVCDVMGAIIMGACALPILAVLVPMILLSMGAPAIFWQERPGRHGRTIRIYKLRSMKHGIDDDGHLIPDEDRETTLGKFLRRTRLDELPQLYSILKGDMSFVGPRPLLPVDLPSDMPQWVSLRAMALPGLTGWAQINGGKAVSKKDKVVLDIWYLANMSLTNDLYIIWKTMKVAIFGETLNKTGIAESYADLNVKQNVKVAVNDNLKRVKRIYEKLDC